MAYRTKRRAPKRRMAKRKGNRKGYASTKVTQMARIVETIEFNRIAPNLVQACNFTIAQFERARTLATNFRWYKPTKVTWTIEPQYNVYQSGPSANSVPYLYSVMNRTQDATFQNLNDLLTQGARPRRLIGASKISYRPNWCSPGLIAGNVVSIPGQFGGAVQNVYMNGMKANYDWLSAPNNVPGLSANTLVTQPFNSLPGVLGNTAFPIAPGSTLFNGHNIFVEQGVPPGGVNPVFKIACTVHWVFKDPKNVLASGTDNIFEELPQPYGPEGPTGPPE